MSFGLLVPVGLEGFDDAAFGLGWIECLAGLDVGLLGDLAMISMWIAWRH